MAKDSKLLLILERSSANLEVNKESGDYILEGIFAQFGVENNNKRIYEEKEYLPHLEYLKKRISENRLMGELDHPEKFEVSLDKVSHIIENLEYDQEKRQIRGRVRLLNTPSGKIAQSLIDSNIPISISSRAAGSVSENKTVSIKRIFTYDLVADPGFESAQLSRINESLGLDKEDSIQVFDASSWDDFNFNDDSKETTKENDIKENLNNNNTMSNEYVSIENMERYSLMVKEEIKSINHKLEELKENNTSSNSNNTEEIKQKVDDLVERLNQLTSKVENNHKYTQYVAEMLDESITWSENEIGGYVNKLIEYTQTELAPHIDGLIEHNNHLAEKLNTTISYVNEEIAPVLDESINHSDYLAEQISNNRLYSEYLAENAVDSDNFDSLVEYTEMVYEGVSSGKFSQKLNEEADEEDKEDKLEGKTNENTSILENKSNDIEKRYSSINEKIDAALAQIKKEKTEKISESVRHPFTKLLNESNRATFSNLNKADKEKVSNALKESGTLGSEALNEKFTSLVEGNFDENSDPEWLSKAPTKYKEIYEKLDESGKAKIAAQAEWYKGKLNSDYQIKNFWATRGLDENVELKNLKEETDTHLIKESEEKIKKMGYSSDRIEAIRKGLKRFK